MILRKKSPTSHYPKRVSITNEGDCQSTLRKVEKHGMTATGMYILTVNEIFWPVEIQIVYDIDRDPPGNSAINKLASVADGLTTHPRPIEFEIHHTIHERTQPPREPALNKNATKICIRDAPLPDHGTNPVFPSSIARRVNE